MASCLDSRRIETFLPAHRPEVQWSDRRKMVARPLFPSLVLARFPASETPQVPSPRGLGTIPRAGSALAAIPAEEIENVRRFAGALTEHRIVPEREALIEAGVAVRVLTRPFAGIEGGGRAAARPQAPARDARQAGEGLAVELDGASPRVIGSGVPRA